MSDSQTHATFLAPDTAHLAPLFPGYEIENLIATGGMGAVYRAVQKSLDRTVAIKILPREFGKDSAFCAAFEAEAKAMARLNDPNLIGVYDFGEVDGMLYIIMEYVPGQSIFHAAHGIAIDPAEVIRLVTGICNGLSHAHENGILHRDIKPSNILLDLNAQPKIGDFGLARPIGTKVQEGEEIFGTPHYTAPEVVNSPQSVGYRADIFSVGVLLHELLTGRLPADDNRPASAIIHCDPRFDAIIRRATNPLPELRYASASEIARDLQAIAKSTGPKVSKPHSPKAPPRPVAGRSRYSAVRSRRTRESSSAFPGIVMLLLAIIVGYISYKFISNGNHPQEAVPIQTTSEPSGADLPALDLPAMNPDSGSTTGSNSEPEPDHDTTPPPDSQPQPESKTNPLPEPDFGNTNSTASKFDVGAFHARARKIIQDRAAPLIAVHDKALSGNLADFERALKRPIRQMDFGGGRDRAEERLKVFIDRCAANKNHIPKKLDAKSKLVRDISYFHADYLQKQEAIDSTLMQSLPQLSATYIQGIEKQIERLKTDNDPTAIQLLEEEIQKIRDDGSYFPSLIPGIAFTEDEPEEDEEKN